jgi:hypothetical protein
MDALHNRPPRGRLVFAYFFAAGAAAFAGAATGAAFAAAAISASQLRRVIFFSVA